MPDAFDGFGEALDALGVDEAALRGHSGATAPSLTEETASET